MELTRHPDGYALGRLSGPLPPGSELRDALEAVREGSEASVVLLDIGDANGGGAADYAFLRRFPLPVICSFDGRLGAGAAGLALCCDVRVCGAGASLTTGALDGVGQALLTSLAAGRNARIATGETEIGAERLLELGLASEIAAAGGAFSAAQQRAATMASRGPIALELGKEAVWRGLGMHFEQSLRFETDLTLLLQTTKDRAEGVAAFLEKRPPRFTGR